MRPVVFIGTLIFALRAATGDTVPDNATCVYEVEYKGSWARRVFGRRKTRHGRFCCLGFKPRTSQHHYVEVNSSAECQPHCGHCPANSACLPATGPCRCATEKQFSAKEFVLQPCSCLGGFASNGTDRCHPICPDLCANGRCTDAKCVCDAGFEVSAVSGRCVALCGGGGCGEGPCAKGCQCRVGLVRVGRVCVECDGDGCWEEARRLEGDGYGQDDEQLGFDVRLLVEAVLATLLLLALGLALGTFFRRRRRRRAVADGGQPHEGPDVSLDISKWITEELEMAGKSEPAVYSECLPVGKGKRTQQVRPEVEYLGVLPDWEPSLGKDGSVEALEPIYEEIWAHKNCLDEDGYLRPCDLRQKRD